MDVEVELQQITFEIESMQHLTCDNHGDNNNKILLFSCFGYLNKLDEGSSRRKDRTWGEEKGREIFHCSITCYVFMFVCIYITKAMGIF